MKIADLMMHNLTVLHRSIFNTGDSHQICLLGQCDEGMSHGPVGDQDSLPN